MDLGGARTVPEERPRPRQARVVGANFNKADFPGAAVRGGVEEPTLRRVEEGTPAHPHRHHQCEGQYMGATTCG